MRSNVISHPAFEPLVMFRRWQLLACGGNECAASLLNLFEYWHGIKVGTVEKNHQANNVAEKHGEARSQDESLWQFHTLDDLEAGLLGLFRRDKIIASIKLLEYFGFITSGLNPNPRYKFDKTKFFLFQAVAVQEWINAFEYCVRESEIRPSKSENRLRSSENRPRQSENRLPASENRRTIEEITSETSLEITLEKEEVPPASPPTIALGPTEEIFEHWKKALNHPKAHLDPKRKRLIELRLKEGFTVEDIKQAIDGCAASPFHQGQNDRATVYDGLELICRDAAKVEAFMGIRENKAKGVNHNVKTGNGTSRDHSAIVAGFQSNRLI